MPLYVQLTDRKGEPLWHAVVSYESAGGVEGASSTFDRRFDMGCGQKVVARADRLIESEAPPWTNRHVAKGCFDSASDPQET